MPFCEDCAKYWAPSALRADGSCPSCGRTVEAPTFASTTPRHRRITADELDLRRLAAGDHEVPKAPWHFKLLVTALVLYLAWRVVDLFV